MKTTLKATAILAIGATMLLGAGSAMARVNVDVSIGGPGVFMPAPVYVAPQPVYVQPQPVYVQPRPVYVQPAPVYSYGHQWRRGYRGGRGDWDHDGVPNRYDRAPNNPYRY